MPQEDEYVFAWCCLKEEPRTFNRNNIQAWQLLPERFRPDPLVDRYWREEGMRKMGDKIPWHRWKEMQQ